MRCFLILGSVEADMLSKIDNSLNFRICPQKTNYKTGKVLSCSTSPIPYDTFHFASKEKNKVDFRGNNLFTKIKLGKQETPKEEDLNNLKLGSEINRGHQAAVYNIKNNPDWVARVELKSKFSPPELEFVKPEEVPNVIASTKDGECKVLRKLDGEPLHGKKWNMSANINPYKYFRELKKLKEIPDEAFAKYCHDVMDLRKESIEIDTVNPNNILYDKNKKVFNLVDIEKKIGVKEKLWIQDFYPFIDAKRLSSLYRKSGDLTRTLLGKSIREFLDRMIRIAKQEGYEIKVEDINRHWVQDFVTYLYHDDQRMLFQYTL